MRNRSDILDGVDFEAGGLQCTDCGFTSGTRALDIDFDGLHTMIDGNLCGGFSGILCSERSRFLRTAEAELAGAGPGYGVALKVSDRYDGVVEGGLNMSRTVFNRLAVAASAGSCVFLEPLFAKTYPP